ncbi:hypothetical protein [Arthrobacter sp. HMWF013]|uniref:hypothetical protein n=1 Tax=Arthrobacter sp. HMWF013 TaxID=2056849 RepID=UPI001C62F5C0|nr:hypothetical protein [Arthrobacter sp. HMWF013]
MLANAWNYESIQYGPGPASRERQELVLGWALEHDGFSQYYDSDTPATEIFSKWLAAVGEAEDLEIHWWMPNIGEGVPFMGRDSHFLTFYRWPTHSDTGERLNWMTLPVEDKAWNAERTDGGGFIQEVTGWKPSPFQRTVHLPTLLRASGWSN